MAKNKIDEQMGSDLLERLGRAPMIPRSAPDEDYDAIGGMTGKRSASDARSRRKAERKEIDRRSHKVVQENRAPVYGRGTCVRRWPAEKDYTTSIVFNRDQYLELTELAYQRRQSVKVLMYELIAVGLKHQNELDKI